jgi:hypothetical protein
MRENEVGRACGMHGRGKKVYKILVGKLKGKRPLRRPRCGWEGGIRLDLREIGGRGVGVWSGYLAQDRDWWLAFVSAVMNLWVSGAMALVMLD